MSGLIMPQRSIYGPRGLLHVSLPRAQYLTYEAFGMITEEALNGPEDLSQQNGRQKSRSLMGDGHRSRSAMESHCASFKEKSF